MKILATGDWHIGNQFHGKNRAEEHGHFLNWLRGMCVKHSPDILLVTGDVFDSKDPTPGSQKQYYSFLRKLSSDCPLMKTVIIAGNHDNPSLLEAPQDLLSEFNIEVRGHISRDPGAEKSPVIKVDTQNGSVIIIAVPYMRRSDFSFEQETYGKAVTEFLSGLVREARETDADVPVVMAAHLYGAGASIAEEDHSESFFVGGEPQINLTALSDRPDFLFSGHIHKRQNINNCPWAQYTGSALPMSFTERRYVHGADLVTFDGKDISGQEFLQYAPLRNLRTYGPETLDKVLEAIREDLDSLDGDYIEAKVKVEGPGTDPETEIRNVLGDKSSLLCDCKELLMTSSGNASDSESSVTTLENAAQLATDKVVMEVLERRFRASVGTDELSDEEKSTLDEILSAAREREKLN